MGADSLEILIAVGSLGVALVLAVRGGFGWPVLLLAAFGVVVGGMAWQTARLESRLSEVAVMISGRPGVTIDCRNHLQDLVSVRAGEVAYDANGTPGTVAELSRSVCDDLEGWIDGGADGLGTDEAIAVHVLTHEIMHLSGHAPEDEAECLAMQWDTATALALGADPGTARTLAEQYAAEVYPRMGGEYRHAHCVEGGPWDRTPGDGQWPGGLTLPIAFTGG